MNRKTFFAAAAAFLLVACAAPGAGPSNVSVKDPWARPAAGGGGMAMGGSTSAAYMTLQNSGAADKLISASTDAAGVVEIHETKAGSGGMMMMAPLPTGLDVPANGSVELKPGGYHIMLMGVKKDLMPGQTFKLQLKFQSGKTIDLDVPVRDPGGK